MRIEETITITEAAKLKGVRRQSIFNAIESGKIKVMTEVAGRKLLSRTDVEAYKPRRKGRDKETSRGQNNAVEP